MAAAKKRKPLLWGRQCSMRADTRRWTILPSFSFSFFFLVHGLHKFKGMVRNMTSSRDDAIPVARWESSAPGGRGGCAAMPPQRRREDHSSPYQCSGGGGAGDERSSVRGSLNTAALQVRVGKTSQKQLSASLGAALWNKAKRLLLL